MNQMIGVPNWDVDRRWPEVLPFIERYLTKSKEHRWNATDLYLAVLNRDMQMWVIEEEGRVVTVVLTEILNYPRVRECNVFMISGKMTTREDWRECVEEIVQWAAEQGCHYISSMARRGSEKAMQWQVRQTYIVRTI